MVGVKEICALLLAGGIGAGSVVTVLQAVPGVKKASAARTAKPAVRKASAPRPAAQATAINDCPSQLGVLGQDMALPPLPPIDVAPGLPLTQTAMAGGGGGGGMVLPGGGGGGGGGIGGTDFTPPGGGGGGVAAVPEPGSWAMLVGGFGLIGLAMRRGVPKRA